MSRPRDDGFSTIALLVSISALIVSCFAYRNSVVSTKLEVESESRLASVMERLAEALEK